MDLTQEQLKQVKRIAVVLLIAFSTMGALYAVELFKESQDALPAEFVEVYDESSTYGNEMMSFAGSVNSTIADINSLDLEGNSSRALELVERAETENERARQRAERVVGYIEELAVATGNIDDPEIKRQAVELLAIESEIIQNFMEYNESMESFLDSLRQAIKNDEANDRLSVDNHLRDANLKIEMVNRLNEEFLRKADELNLH